MKQKTKTSLSAGKQGSALIFATILLFAIVATVAALSVATVFEMKSSQKTKSSVGAFFNAESGIEWSMNKITTVGGGQTILGAFPSFASGKTPCPAGFNCDVYFLDNDGNVISSSSETLANVKAVRVVGTNSTGEVTQRAIEAAVAAKGISFTYYCYFDPPPSPFAALGSPVCNDAGLPQGHCPAGYTEELDLGSWGFCGNSGWVHYFLPPGGTCSASYGSYAGVLGDAYICSK